MHTSLIWTAFIFLVDGQKGLEHWMYSRSLDEWAPHETGVYPEQLNLVPTLVHFNVHWYSTTWVQVETHSLYLGMLHPPTIRQYQMQQLFHSCSKHLHIKIHYITLRKDSTPATTKYKEN